jgi:branched-chain amino acid transport system substrate-binding protein
MRTDRARLAGALAAAVAVLAGCGADEEPFRIGVLADCIGIYRSLGDAELSGAQLPLIERGAQPRGSRPGDGVTSVSVAGTPVELVRACTELGEFSTMFEQVRRLVERESVDAVIGGTLGVDGVGLRMVAAELPDTTFVALPGGAREVTLRERAPNLFRLEADHGQAVAGLGSYAFRDLGWRRASVLLHDWDAGWGAAAAFVAEFCSLGGTVTRQRLDVLDPKSADAARVPRGSDGVAVLTTSFFGSSQASLLRRLAARFDGPAQHVVLGPGVLDEEAALRVAGTFLGGAAAATRYPQAALTEFAEGYRRAFPGQPAANAKSELVIAHRDAVEALLQALEEAGGDPGERGERLRAALGALEIELLGVPRRVDENGQAVVSATLVRVAPGGGGPPLRPLRTIAEVDQSVGGLLDPDHRPGAFDETCEEREPPPWAAR